ncbi:uncharacterized protein SPAPADRAFT_139992 [Spathaspora passalidarum NRRL Y-27907]|uniref:Uncharacterized protein n=1 Tax=Spathaspora passalidarum (strain NRRL Y-27907 / 11-Y1) TaxID=619300 RepID=G3AQB2_SPAPN|nr:uncharacterized protein SPAPADRAFT_139992 [Spathaspora passalidarum NRRL Y-27907]EGW31459.1 hypothetical protein SPAPADRAFT_139992 [Spathaspora passalidarum NRRL Y-27907]
MNIHRCRFVDYTPHTITATAFSHTSSLSKPPSTDLRLAVGRSNGDIEIWNPRYNWTHELTLPGSKDRSIEGLCWAMESEDNSESLRLFSIGGSTYITEWDLATGKPLTNYDCNAGIIWSIDISADNEKLAVGCDDGSVVIVDISGGKGSLEYDLICQRQDARVLSIKWVDNSTIIGGCADGRIRSWSASQETKGRIMATMRVDKSKTESTLVWSLTILPNKRQFASGDSTGSVKIWDLDHYSLLQSFKVHEADVLSLVHDVNQEKLFSAGVDRKIHQFDLTSTKSTSKWVHSFNRLLHSNDIRSMSIFENKGYSFLISGGVERAIVIQDVQSFHDGKYKKLLINQQKSNVIVNENKRLIFMWQDQTVKIWRASSEDSEKPKLVCKLSLSDDENITSIDFNEGSNLLAVSKMTSVTIFQLEESKSKLKVHKIRDENFVSLVEGAKLVKFISATKFLVLTSDEELYKFEINVEEEKIELEDEIELIANKQGKLPYAACIKNLIVTPNGDNLIISRFNGSIEIYPLGEGEAYVLTKLSNNPHLIACSDNDKLLVLSEDNKILEFFIKQDSTSLLTPWSRRNSEFLPQQFTTLEDKAQGMFVKDEKVWIFGSTWVAYFDLTMNIPIGKAYKNANNSKKRTRTGLSINEDEFENDMEESVDILETSLKQSEIDRLRQQIQDDEQQPNGSATSNRKPFFVTEKYRPIMKVADCGTNEIMVIERPYFALPSTPAFNLPKLKI